MTPSTRKRLTYRRRETAEMLGLSTRTIDRMVADGRLKGVRPDYFRLISAASVHAYVAAKSKKDKDVATDDATAAAATDEPAATSPRNGEARRIESAPVVASRRHSP